MTTQHVFDVPSGLHPETAAMVGRFATALAAKLKRAEDEYGYSDGWRSPDWRGECAAKLREHVEKGDPLDVAAFCAFQHHHAWATNDADHLLVNHPTEDAHASRWYSQVVKLRFQHLEATREERVAILSKALGMQAVIAAIDTYCRQLQGSPLILTYPNGDTVSLVDETQLDVSWLRTLVVSAEVVSCEYVPVLNLSFEDDVPAAANDWRNVCSNPLRLPPDDLVETLMRHSPQFMDSWWRAAHYVFSKHSRWEDGRLCVDVPDRVSRPNDDTLNRACLDAERAIAEFAAAETADRKRLMIHSVEAKVRRYHDMRFVHDHATVLARHRVGEVLADDVFGVYLERLDDFPDDAAQEWRQMAIDVAVHGLSAEPDVHSIHDGTRALSTTQRRMVAFLKRLSVVPARLANSACFAPELADAT